MLLKLLFCLKVVYWGQKCYLASTQENGIPVDPYSKFIGIYPSWVGYKASSWDRTPVCSGPCQSSGHRYAKFVGSYKGWKSTAGTTLRIARPPLHWLFLTDSLLPLPSLRVWSHEQLRVARKMQHVGGKNRRIDMVSFLINIEIIIDVNTA